MSSSLQAVEGKLRLLESKMDELKQAQTKGLPVSDINVKELHTILTESLHHLAKYEKGLNTNKELAPVKSKELDSIKGLLDSILLRQNSKEVQRNLNAEQTALFWNTVKDFRDRLRSLTSDKLRRGQRVEGIELDQQGH